jgi:hypothetical protein
MFLKKKDIHLCLEEPPKFNLIGYVIQRKEKLWKLPKIESAIFEI